MSAANRVLLVSPAFHGYWKSIQRAFQTLGYDVRSHVYDDYTTIGSKIHNKLVYELPDRVRSGTGTARLSLDVTSTACEALRRHRPDVVLAVKSDLIGPAFWDDVEARHLPSVLWLYDELRRSGHRTADLRRFDAVASYSGLDVDSLRALGIEAHHVPNAFDPTFDSPGLPSDEVVFVGARYPNRERLLEMLHQNGVKVHAYGRDWSHHPLDRLRTWQLRRPAIPAGRDVARGTGYQLMAGATATLNVHNDQDGFTMRTFEAAGVGALQLIDRADVKDLYEPEREIVVFGSDEELVELCSRAQCDPTWRRSVADAGRKRTLAEHTFIHRARKLAELWD